VLTCSRQTNPGRQWRGGESPRQPLYCWKIRDWAAVLAGSAPCGGPGLPSWPWLFGAGSCGRASRPRFSAVARGKPPWSTTDRPGNDAAPQAVEPRTNVQIGCGSPGPTFRTAATSLRAPRSRNWPGGPQAPRTGCPRWKGWRRLSRNWLMAQKPRAKRAAWNQALRQRPAAGMLKPWGGGKRAKQQLEQAANPAAGPCRRTAKTTWAQPPSWRLKSCRDAPTCGNDVCRNSASRLHLKSLLNRRRDSRIHPGEQQAGT